MGEVKVKMSERKKPGRLSPEVCRGMKGCCGDVLAATPHLAAKSGTSPNPAQPTSPDTRTHPLSAQGKSTRYILGTENI